MAEYDNTNRGVLFKNKEKAQDSHADYTGNVNVDGVDYWLNAWVKTAKSGKMFMSLSLKPKQVQEKPQDSPQSPMQGLQEMSDDIPF